MAEEGAIVVTTISAICMKHPVSSVGVMTENASLRVIITNVSGSRSKDTHEGWRRRRGGRGS